MKAAISKELILTLPELSKTSDKYIDASNYAIRVY